MPTAEKEIEIIIHHPNKSDKNNQCTNETEHMIKQAAARETVGWTLNNADADDDSSVNARLHLEWLFGC